MLVNLGACDIGADSFVCLIKLRCARERTTMDASIGSPTLGGHMPTQVSAMLGNILRLEAAKALPCGAYGSYGWSGEAVDILHGRLKDSGFTIAFEPIKIQFRPDAKAIQVCEESGTDLAQGILKEKKKTQMQTERRSSSLDSASSSGETPLGSHLFGSETCTMIFGQGPLQPGCWKALRFIPEYPLHKWPADFTADSRAQMLHAAASLTHGVQWRHLICRGSASHGPRGGVFECSDLQGWGCRICHACVVDQPSFI